MNSPMLSDAQLKAISEISADIAQVALASMVIPFIISDFRQDVGVKIITGLLLAFLFWSMSILLVKKIKI